MVKLKIRWTYKIEIPVKTLKNSLIKSQHPILHRKSTKQVKDERSKLYGK